jgi:hypothetical protein
MDLFNENGWTTEEERLPTLRQYLNLRKNKTIPRSFLVTLVWLPNKFPSYAFECDKFRLSIPTKSALGKSLSTHLDSVVRSDMAFTLGVVVEEGKAPTVTFKQSTEKVTWAVIGEDPIIGYRLVQN